MIVHKRGRGRVKNNSLLLKQGAGIADVVKPIMNVINGVIQHKDLISKTVNAAKDLFSVGKELKDLVTSKPQKKAPTRSEPNKELLEIIAKINSLKSGVGFAYA